MSVNAEHRSEPTSFIDDIEKRVSELFSAQKSEVEQSLVERINREKEEAQKRIEAVNQEFSKVRTILDEHKAVMADLQAAEAHVRGQIRGHFDRALNYQKMMENAAGLAGDELERIAGLNQELEGIRAKAEAEYTKIKQDLSGYAGISAQIPPPAAGSGGDVDWNEELSKLKKIRDLLATLRQVEYAAAPGAEAVPPVFAPFPAPMPPAPRTEAVSMEDDGVRDDAEFAESDPAWGDIPVDQAGDLMVAPALAEEPFDESPSLPADHNPLAGMAPPPSGTERQSLLETLGQYRKSEPVNNGIELGFFAAEAGAVLDAESFMTAIGKILDSASQLHTQLGQTESVKDLFLLKQEILNQQEVLRKVYFRIVRFCDKEGGKLPEVLSEIISAQGMKDTIERLTMANWSDPSDFRPFLNELKAMKKAFEVRLVASTDYLRTLLDQVEGRN
jgi:hypothetical protein